MTRAAIVAATLALTLTACRRERPPADTPGARLEAAAVARGLVAPDTGALTGVWASDTDRVCVVAPEDRGMIGAAVDYGDGQGCVARGTVRRRGGALRVAFGDCRFDARYDGDRIVFPATMPAACDAPCTGRASLAALSVERLSDSASEAAAMRAPDGVPLCTPDD